jgi:tetratricopeptide (TPR) repeat protein
MCSWVLQMTMKGTAGRLGPRLREAMTKGKQSLGGAWVGVAVLAALLWASTANAESSAPKLLSEGYALLRSGDVAAAEATYLAAAWADPSYAPAWLVLGDFYHGVRNDCGAAVPWYDGYLERASGIAAPIDAVLENLISCHEGADNWDAAAEGCSRLVVWNRDRRRHDDAHAALRRRAENEIRAGRYEQALSTLGLLLFEDADDRRVWELRGFCRFQLGQFQEALEDQYWIRSAFGPDRFVNREIGAVLFKLGKYEPARTSLRLSLKIDGEHPDTFRWLARAWEESAGWLEAERAWRSCLRASPGSRLRALAHNNLAWLLVSQSRRGDPRLLEAYTLARSAVDANGMEPKYQDTLAEVYLRLGRPTDALACARLAFRQAPSEAYYRDRFVALRDAADGHPTTGGARRFQRSLTRGLKSGAGPSRNPER